MIRHRMRGWEVWSHSAANGEGTRRRRYCVLERLENRTLLSGSPTVYTVDLTGGTGASTSADEGTLLYCVTQANVNPNTAGSEIEFDPTVFATPQTITLFSTLVLAETQGPEAIDGPGATDVTISGNNAVEVLSVSSGVAASLSGLTVADGQDPMPGQSAGGIFNQGTLALTGCTVSGNFNAFSFSDDTKYSDFGGGITNQGTLTVANSTISGNTAGEGGGIFNDSDGTIKVTGSTISGNSAGAGGGILNEGTVTITGCTISGNSAINIGGGIYNGLLYGTLTLTGCTISGNHARYGGAVSNNFSGTATVTDCTLSGNAATSNAGGAIFTSSSEPVTVTGTTISNNMAAGDGGGIYNGGPNLTVTDCTLSGNTAAAGGGIYADNPTTVIGSTVSGNSASGSGGGIAIERFELTAVNCTIAGNSAGTSGGGLWDNGPATLTNCTIAYNVASDGGGGGLAAVAGVATLDNTIVALNTDVGGTPADDIAKSGGNLSATSEYNLIGTGGAGGLINGSSNNLVGIADPGLDTLADYGGPTQTIALLPASPAIDAGSPAFAVDPEGNTLTTDQRGAGYPRIVNGTVDIGAYETGPTIFTVDLTTDTGASTSASAGDLLYCITQANAETNPSGSVIQFDPTVFATPQTITLTSTLELYNPNVPEVIDGPGANLAAISGNNAVVVFNAGGEAATIAGLTIEDGSDPGLDGIGGGIESGGTVTVNDCTVSHNEAGDFGGGIGNAGTLTVDDCTFSQNLARGHGGGIGNINGEVTVTDSIISDNSGGGFWETGGKLTIQESTVDDNSGPGISATSGGNHSGTVSVSGCAIAGNSSERGGGIFVSDGALTVVNSTIADNSATESGGGIEVTERSRPLTVVNSTIADNDVNVGSPGGGLFVDENCTAILNNTIVAQNTNGTGADPPPDDIGGPGTVSGSFNLIGTGGSAGLANGTNGNQVGVANPGLGALADNGGPTETIALLAASPAINTGNTSLAVAANGDPLSTDQRGTGFARIVGGSVDIGAFEFQLNPVPSLTLISPHKVVAGDTSPITVVVEGSDFDSQSVVDWNATALATAFVSLTELTATIPTSDFASAGNDSITVTNPSPGGGTSNAVAFQVVGTSTPPPSNVPAALVAVTVGWGQETAPLFTAADGLTLLPEGRRNDLPWLGIDQIQITLSEPATLTAADVTIQSAKGVDYGPVTISGSGTTDVITLARTIDKADRITITIAGPAIAGFTRRLDVLPGDVNDDGVVNNKDVTEERKDWHSKGGAQPTIFGDILGNATVNASDLSAVRKRLGTKLPKVTVKKTTLKVVRAGRGTRLASEDETPSVRSVGGAHLFRRLASFRFAGFDLTRRFRR